MLQVRFCRVHVREKSGFPLLSLCSGVHDPYCVENGKRRNIFLCICHTFLIFNSIVVVIKTNRNYTFHFPLHVARVILHKFHKNHAIRKSDTLGSAKGKIKGRGRYKSWTPTAILRASFLVSYTLLNSTTDHSNSRFTIQNSKTKRTHQTILYDLSFILSLSSC